MSASAFRGALTADGFVIDAPLLGEAESQARLLNWWQPGAIAKVLPDGRWVLVLPHGVPVRAERAPGLPLVSVGGGWASFGSSAHPGMVAVPVGGGVVASSLGLLPFVPMAGWFDLGMTTVHLLTPLSAAVPPGAAPLAEPPAAVPPDLRQRAKVGQRDARAARAVESLAGAYSQGGRTRPGGASAGGASPKGRLLQDLVARLALRSPAAGLLTRQHRKYIETLTQQLQRGDWDAALRDAIPLGGGGTGLTLRLPARRSGALQPMTRQAGGGGGSVPFGPTVHAHLNDQYRRAAAVLERDGKHIEAAFVFSDLLRTPALAVSVLERGGQHRLAAELAEGHALDPELIIRLWWRAGDRARAVLVARSRGVFASAVARLEQVDAAAAVDLRAEWVRACQLAGDHVAAVRAAWPVAALRPLVLSDIQMGIARGGHPGAVLFAHLASHVPTDAVRDAALALLDSRADEQRPSRDAFAVTLAGLPCSDATADRQLTSAAVRSLLRDALRPSHVDAQGRTKALRALQKRADRVLVADLPPLRRPTHAPSDPIDVAVDALAGDVQLHDAVALPGGVVLVALGDAGTRLLTQDGRVRGRWDAPATQLTVADHAGSVLLVAARGDAYDMHHLDLVSRKVTRRPSLRARAIANTYDGSRLTIVDNDGIAIVDALADRPVALWRELSASAVVHDLSRNADTLTAIVSPGDPGQPRVEMWVWTLPTMRLRRRVQIDPSRIVANALMNDGRLVTVETHDDGLRFRWRNEARLDDGASAPHVSRLRASGDLAAIVKDDEAGGIEILLTRGESGEPLTRVHFAAGKSEGVRVWGELATVFDLAGRVVAVDMLNRAVVANFRTSA